MALGALRLLDPVLPPLPDRLCAGRLVELSGSSLGTTPTARTTTAVAILRHAQREGETAAWVQPRGGPLYPPDLHDAGIDLDALVVIHVPPGATGPRPRARSASGGGVEPHRLCKAAELLLRSGAFGLVVIDLCDAVPTGSDAWQGRLLGLSRQHRSKVVLLTDKPSHADSLGPLIGLRVEPQRFREASGRFAVEHRVLKNKSGAPFDAARDHLRGPWGLG